MSFFRFTLLLIGILPFVGAPLHAVDFTEKKLTLNGVSRSYLLHGDLATPGLPLVIILHGRGGDPKGIERQTHFSTVADQNHFLAAYPVGINQGWNDGRGSSDPNRDKIDDVGFIAAMVAKIGIEEQIDRRRVYVTGMSNGGIMTHYLACRLPHLFAAAAAVSGPLAQAVAEQGLPYEPVPMLMIHGTDDQVVPITGGRVRVGQEGNILSFNATAQRWIDADHGLTPASSLAFPSAQPNSPLRSAEAIYRNADGIPTVIVITVEKGGHTWPVGMAYSPEIDEPTCRDFDASEVIWDFFKTHSLP